MADRVTEKELNFLSLDILKDLCDKKDLPIARSKKEIISTLVPHLSLSKDLINDDLKDILDGYKAKFTERMNKSQLITLLQCHRNGTVPDSSCPLPSTSSRAKRCPNNKNKKCSLPERTNRFGTPPPLNNVCSIVPPAIQLTTLSVPSATPSKKTGTESFLVSPYELLSLANKREDDEENNIEYLVQEFIPGYLTDHCPQYAHLSLWDQLKLICEQKGKSSFLSRDELEEICDNYEAKVGSQWVAYAHSQAGVPQNVRRTKDQFTKLITIYKTALPDTQLICDPDLRSTYVTSNTTTPSLIPLSSPSLPQPKKVQRRGRVSSLIAPPALSITPPIQKPQNNTDFFLQKLQNPQFLAALQSLMNS